MDSLQFLDEVWQEQMPGFVFISIKRRDGGWEDLAYYYGTKDADELELPESSIGDVYFCPNTFSKPHRREEFVLPSRWLYADFDAVVPIQNEAELSPTIAWESSPDRYQGLWLLDKFLPRERHRQLNKRLTYALGADKGGWDITQVLRVPGTINHKYAEKPEVTLLWQ